MSSSRSTKCGIPSSKNISLKFLLSALPASLLAMLILTAPESNLRKVGAEPSQNNLTISTIAGGGFGSNVMSKQAAMVLPTAVALDPQGRGFYVVDEVNGTSLLRFVNTSSATVNLCGVAIQPNNINLIAGGGLATNDNINPRDTDLAE